MSKARKIPNGWAFLTIEDLALRIHYGYTASALAENTGVKLLRITDIQDYRVNWNTVPYCSISEFELGKFLLKDGDILFARTGATVGKSFLIQGVPPKAVFASYLIRIQLSRYVIPKFIFYFFQSLQYWQQIEENSRGIGQPNVNASSLSKISLAVPPTTLQSKIVLRIEEIFSDIDKSVESLERVEKLIKTYWKVVLQKAFTGVLSQKWRNSRSVSDIEQLREKLDNVDSFRTGLKPLNKSVVKVLPKLPKDWKWVKLDDIIDLISGQHILERDYNSEGQGIPYLTGPSDFGVIHPVVSKWTTTPKVTALAGDILITVKGSGVGKINILNFKCAISRQLMAARLKYGPNRFLYFFLEYQFDRIQNLSSGTAIPGIDRESILNLPYPLPSSEEQLFIVQELESRLSIASNLSSSISNRLREIDGLKNVTLERAFSDQLAPEDLDSSQIKEMLFNINADKEQFEIYQQTRNKTRMASTSEKEKNKSILEILSENDSPNMLAKEAWINSKHWNNVDGFYSELKSLVKEGVVVELPRIGRESRIALKSRAGK
jgi:type I restriction enzyme S subunit